MSDLRETIARLRALLSEAPDLTDEERGDATTVLDAAEKWERLKALAESTMVSGRALPSLEDALESVERDMRKEGSNG